MLILELWFNKSIESGSFRDRSLGLDGEENGFTRFNTTHKWQEQALEEGGLNFESLSYRCIYDDFGTAKQVLNDEELRKVVYQEVVQPLERKLQRYMNEGYFVNLQMQTACSLSSFRPRICASTMNEERRFLSTMSWIDVPSITPNSIG